MPAANSIFVSYRRSDSDYVTGHVYEKLRSHFGQSIVFKDTDSIPLGVDIREYIKEAIATSQVLVAVIGARWLDALNQRTTEARKDWVREEIEAAFAKGSMPIIPLLVEGVQMPIEEDLPESLKALVYRNAAQVRPALDFDQDVDRLIKGLEEILSASRTAVQANQLKLSYIRGEINQLQHKRKAIEKKLRVKQDGSAENELLEINKAIGVLEQEERGVVRSLNQEGLQLCFAELKTTLESYSDRLDDMLIAYLNVLRQRGWQRQSKPKTLNGIIVQLLRIPQGESAHEAIEEFVAQLIMVTENKDLISALQNWGEQRLPQSWAALLTQTEQSQLVTLANSAEPALLVKINRSDEASTQSETEKHYQIKAWLIRDVQHYRTVQQQGAKNDQQKGISPIDIPGTTGDETYSMSALSGELPKLISQFLTESSHLFDIDPELHIFLPLELMNQAIDRWQLDDDYSRRPRPLGRQYKVVLRCTERVSRSYRQEKLWKQKWQHHQSCLTKLAHGAFIVGNDSDLDELYYDLDEAEESIVGLKVSAAPTCEDADNLFAVLLQVGMPLAIWGREDLVQVTNESELDRVLNRCCLENLPLTVKEERRQARSLNKDSHVGHHLSLLWDDPYLIPPRSA